MSPSNKKKLFLLRKKLDLIDNKMLNLLKLRANYVKKVLSLKEFKNHLRVYTMRLLLSLLKSVALEIYCKKWSTKISMKMKILK